MLSGAGDIFDAGNVEGAQWPKLGEKQKDEIGTPHKIPMKEENKPVSSFGTAPDGRNEQIPLFGTIVPPKNPPILERLGHLLFPLDRKRSLSLDLSFLWFLNLCRILPCLDRHSTIMEGQILVHLKCTTPLPHKNSSQM